MRRTGCAGRCGNDGDSTFGLAAVHFVGHAGAALEATGLVDAGGAATAGNCGRGGVGDGSQECDGNENARTKPSGSAHQVEGVEIHFSA